MNESVMEWVAVTARTIKLPDPAAPCARPTTSARNGLLVGMFVVMRQFIMRDGVARLRAIIQMAVHMQMAFAIMFCGDTSARSIAHQDIGSANWRLVPAGPVSDRLKPALLTTEPRKVPKAQYHDQHPSKAPAALIHACRPDGSTWPKRRQCDPHP